jgi:hypothetical protein
MRRKSKSALAGVCACAREKRRRRRHCWQLQLEIGVKQRKSHPRKVCSFNKAPQVAHYLGKLNTNKNMYEIRKTSQILRIYGF